MKLPIFADTAVAFFWTRLVCCFPLCFDVLDPEYQMKTIANSFSSKFLWCLYLHNLFTHKIDVKYSLISCGSASRQALIYIQYFVFLRFMLLSDGRIVHCIWSTDIETALSLLCSFILVIQVWCVKMLQYLWAYSWASGVQVEFGQ